MSADDEGYRTIIDKRHVARRACLLCRSKKIKCDGESMEMRLDASGGPLICSNCESSGLECVFIKSRRGGRRKRKSISIASPGEVVMLLLPLMMSAHKGLHRQNPQQMVTGGEYGQGYIAPILAPRYQVFTPHHKLLTSFGSRGMEYHPEYGMPTPQDFGDNQPGKYASCLAPPYPVKADYKQYVTHSAIPRIVLPPFSRPMTAMDGAQANQFAWNKMEGHRIGPNTNPWLPQNEWKPQYAQPMPTKLPAILPPHTPARDVYGSSNRNSPSNINALQARQTPPQLFRTTRQNFAVENERVVLPQPVGYNNTITYQHSKPFTSAGPGETGNYASANTCRTLIRP